MINKIQKDRLLKILNEIQTFGTKCIAKKNEVYGNYIDEENIGNVTIVDYLLENGVIVPSCKVGEDVWFYKAELEEICPAKVIKIENNYYNPSMPIQITIQYNSTLTGRQEVQMAECVFELLCYKTKEEAEKHLKKGTIQND